MYYVYTKNSIYQDRHALLFFKGFINTIDLDLVDDSLINSLNFQIISSLGIV